MATNATAFTSPLASVKYGPVNIPPQLEYVVDYVSNTVSNASMWQIALTLLAIAVVYDQCTFSDCDSAKGAG
jgi:C-22 sterol desaturase